MMGSPNGGPSDAKPDGPGPDSREAAARAPDESDASARPAKSRRPNRGATVLIGALLALLGFALAVQLRSNSSKDALAGAREDDLVTILDDQNSRLDRLQDQLNTLQDTKQKLTDSGNDVAAARAEAARQAAALEILTGTVAAHGPGIVITITDPEHKLAAEDLLDVIEELRGAGAEVIQFGTARVSTSTALTDNAGSVFVDGIAQQAPYRVLAIGEPSTMTTALNIAGGVTETVRTDGGNVVIARQATVSITATRPLSPHKYASQTSK